MGCLSFNKKLVDAIIVVCLILGVTSFAEAQSIEENNEASAVSTLENYINMRIQDAEWKDYAKYVTWPDEPAWDEKWVVTGYMVGPENDEGQKIIVPVTYTRIGLYGYDFQFNKDAEKVTINYELIHTTEGWKVSGPDIDYPELGADKLIQYLRDISENVNESPERRAQADATAHAIEGAVNSDK